MIASRIVVMLLLASCSRASSTAPQVPDRPTPLPVKPVPAPVPKPGYERVAPPTIAIQHLIASPLIAVSMSPHFARIKAIWPAVCEQRGQLQPDVMTYALAWCDHRNGTGELVRTLAGLQMTAVPGLAAAALEDAANLLADSGVENALAILQRPGFPPIRSHRLVAAVYTELDRIDDALAVLRASPSTGIPEDECERDVAQLLLRFDRKALDQLWAIAARPGSACSDRVRLATRCNPQRLVPSASRRRFGSAACPTQAPNADLGGARIIAAYALWGLADDLDSWLVVAGILHAALTVPGAEAAIVAALRNVFTGFMPSFRGGRCDPAAVDAVAALATRVRTDPAHSSQHDGALDELIGMSPQRCFARFGAP